MPVSVETFDLEGTDQQLTMEYEPEVILNQPMHTDSMAVNPYQAFEPIPPKVRLYPQVDRWTVTQSRWSSPITRRFTTGHWWNLRRTTTVRTTTQVLRRTYRAAEYLRRRYVTFNIVNFGPGEQLKEIIFDGVRIQSV